MVCALPRKTRVYNVMSERSEAKTCSHTTVLKSSFIWSAYVTPLTLQREPHWAVPRYAVGPTTTSDLFFLGNWAATPELIFMRTYCVWLQLFFFAFFCSGLHWNTRSKAKSRLFVQVWGAKFTTHVQNWTTNVCCTCFNRNPLRQVKKFQNSAAQWRSLHSSSLVLFILILKSSLWKHCGATDRKSGINPYTEREQDIESTQQDGTTPLHSTCREALGAMTALSHI